MSVITIPKQLMREKELVLIPKKEHEELLGLKKVIKVVKPTAAEKRAIERGRKEMVKGDFVTLEGLKKELGF
ncbi:MAG: hypothetical protein Q8Q89_00205 [bacterium]|nr:hypothetical protein [bacterium]